MIEKAIYLAGGMSDLTYEEQMNWRVDITALLNDFESDNYKPIICNPAIYCDAEDERGMMLFDLYKVRTSDLIIVNYNDVKSLGTMSEVAIAYDRRIPIVGLCKDKKELHPWQLEMTNKMFTNMEELAEHVMIYYLS